MDANKSIAARFSAAARTYQDSAVVQRAVAERLAAMLDVNPMPDRILEVGCGTGLLTAHVCRLFPQSRIDAVDSAAGMVGQCRMRLASAPGLHCHVADLKTFRAEALYHLIVSSSALHWLFPVEQVMKLLSGMLAEHGQFVFAVMVCGTLSELHEARARVAPHKLPERKLPTKQAVRDALSNAGLHIEHEHIESRQLVYASAVELLGQLHDQGLTGGPLSRSKELLNRADLGRLAQDYETNYRAGDGVYASYHAAYFRARKAT